MVFRVAVVGDIGEQAGGEAESARWLLPEEVDEHDGPTRQILDAARAVLDPGAYLGRVVTS
ncbi:hypothetical protein ASD06_06020 [Angustibacter sp. Root456]|nr:hypothetical protein ASD06_06020 [Angustibacter sp. Root456]